MTSKVTLVRDGAGAFTLLELLAVMAVIVTLATLSLGGMTRTLISKRITNATQLVIEEIQVGRATALAQSKPVEIWFLKESNYYQSVRSSIINPDNTATWITGSRKLPEGTVLASAEKYSSVIGAQNAIHPDGLPLGTQGVRLRIFPSGRIELTDALPTATPIGPNDFLYLTITSYAGFDPNGEEALPPNFATVQINPINSRVIVHRP